MMKRITDGSRSPERVPIRSPSSGVNPMVVSTETPWSTAAMLQPLPRWQVMILSVLMSLPSRAAARSRDKPVGGSVKSVPPDLVLRVERIGNAVQVRALRHLRVKGRVEHAHLRRARQIDLACGNAPEIVRIVQRRQLDVLPERPDHFVRDQDRAGERLAAVHHAVADGVDVRLVVDDAVVPAQEDRQDVFDGDRCGRRFPRRS